MLHKELSVMLRAHSAAWDNLGYRVMEKHGPAPGTAIAEVPGYVHELRGSPSHRLGGRDQPFGPARVLGIKLLSCCCPLLL